MITFREQQCRGLLCSILFFFFNHLTFMMPSYQPPDSLWAFPSPRLCSVLVEQQSKVSLLPFKEAKEIPEVFSPSLVHPWGGL